MTQTQVAIYCRISSDKTGEAAGVARQEALCREYAASKGWTVSEVLTDNDISATSGKTRPAWEQLLAGLEAGTYGGVVAYHADRLYRSLRDLVRLLDLHKVKSFELGTVTGDLDLGTDQGRLMAGILGVVAAGEVERFSARRKAGIKARAHAGKTLHKYRIFGWQEDHITLDETEAAEIKRGYAGLIDGSTSLGEIGRRWTELGLNTHAIKNRKGEKASGEWTAAKVRLIFQRDRNCGRAVHLGKVVGVGEWEPIVSEQDHDLLQSIFAGRTVDRDNRRKHAISGLPVCGKCGKPGMLATVINQRPYYTCRPSGHLGIAKHVLDELVENHLRVTLSDPESLAVKNLNLTDTLQRIRSAQESLGALSAEETELGESDLPLNILKARGAKLAAKRTALEAELVSLMAGDRVSSLIADLSFDWKGSAKDALAFIVEFQKRWNALSPIDQNLILKTLFVIKVNPEVDHKGDAMTRALRRVEVLPKDAA